MSIFKTTQVFFVFAALLLLQSTLQSQTITITGKAYDVQDPKLPLPKLMVINKRTNQGVFADSEGKFSLSAIKSDTLLFSSLGFMVKKICLKDSTEKKIYYVEVGLRKLEYTLKEVSVFANRNLNEIQKDIDKLGVKKNYTTIGAADALSSPITFLYERFSKFARSKQKVAEWENEDLRRDVLKELFRVYIKNDIIDLPDEEFDAFINYLNLSNSPPFTILLSFFTFHFFFFLIEAFILF